MSKYLLLPDSFKGSLSSSEICAAMSAAIRSVEPDAAVVSLPVADGGEGSVDCFLEALSGEKNYLTVKGPYFEKQPAFYAIVAGDAAVIEMAACAGLPLVSGNKDPEKTTTYGVGQLIAAALSRGVGHIILGLGGSATNDMGCGCAAALGVKFYNAAGEEFVPTGGTLKDIERIDASGVDGRLAKTRLTAMCDIDSPLCGEQGAAYVFAPQKGADEAMVKRLDAGLAHAAAIVSRDLSRDVANVPGAGAAGGMGAGVMAFLGFTLRRGIDTVLDALHFDELIPGTDCVFTGEGKIDSQSLRGKVVIGVAKRCKEQDIPCVAVVGDVGAGATDCYAEGVTAIFSANRRAVPLSEARKTAEADVYAVMCDIMRFRSVWVR